MTVAHGTGPIVVASRDISRRSAVVGLGFGGIAAALAAAGWSVEALAQDSTPAASPEPARALNALVTLYGVPEDQSAFDEYLHSTHIPLIREVPGVQHILLHTNITTTEFVPPDVYVIGTVVFESQADLETAIASDEGMTAIADVGNFASGGFFAYSCHVETIPVTDEATPMA